MPINMSGGNSASAAFAKVKPKAQFSGTERANIKSRDFTYLICVVGGRFFDIVQACRG